MLVLCGGREQRQFSELWDSLFSFVFVPQELKESFNYGLFSPPENGRAGKFLDEERRLGDYPFNGPVGYLEVRLFQLIIEASSMISFILKEFTHRSFLS